VTQKEDALLFSGKGHPERNAGVESSIAALASRDVERRFQLADHVRVTGARPHTGLLSHRLQRALPEEKEPR
jgi:molecular chaperone IbpA